jgi:hypothetical protein
MNMGVLWTKNSKIRAVSIHIQFLTDCFLNRTQVKGEAHASPQISGAKE